MAAIDIEYLFDRSVIRLFGYSVIRLFGFEGIVRLVFILVSLMLAAHDLLVVRKVSVDQYI